MKKFLTLALALALVAVMIQAPLAGSCSGHKKAEGAKASLTSDKAHCSATDAAACAAKLGMDPEECKTLCATGDYTLVSMSVEGMTCAGCENSITAALKELPGVVKVGRVSHKEGRAYVLVDPKLSTDKVLVSTVTGKGYKAEVIPANVVTTNANKTGDAKGCGMTASAKKACSKTCATPCGTKKTEEKKDKADGTL